MQSRRRIPGKHIAKLDDPLFNARLGVSLQVTAGETCLNSLYFYTTSR